MHTEVFLRSSWIFTDSKFSSGTPNFKPLLWGDMDSTGVRMLRSLPKMATDWGKEVCIITIGILFSI